MVHCVGLHATWSTQNIEHEVQAGSQRVEVDKFFYIDDGLRSLFRWLNYFYLLVIVMMIIYIRPRLLVLAFAGFLMSSKQLETKAYAMPPPSKNLAGESFPVHLRQIHKHIAFLSTSMMTKTMHHVVLSCTEATPYSRALNYVFFHFIRCRRTFMTFINEADKSDV